MDRSKSMDDMPVLIGARPKTQAARERARLQMERTRSNSRGRSVHTRRTRGSAAEIEDDSTPTRPRTDSTDLVDTPIGMGPATALTSPTRYSDIGTAGVELTTEPAGVDGAMALPAPPFYDVSPPRIVSPWRPTTSQPPPASSWTSNTWNSVIILPPSYNPTIGLTSLPRRKELPGPGGTLLAPTTPQ